MRSLRRKWVANEDDAACCSLSGALYPPGARNGPTGRQQSLRDYAFIADGSRGALIGPSGGRSRGCVFRVGQIWAIFTGLLDSGGAFRVAPEDHFVTGGYYEEASLIWHSRWVTHHGIFESRDALAYPGSPERAITPSFSGG